ncbi:MAG: M14 family metallopeptidase [Rhodothermales bacterium]
MASTAYAQEVPSPADVFGFEVGADYKLADYDQLRDYYRQLDEASNRVQTIEIGESVLGRPMLLLFISSEENLQNLGRWREISEKLARARISEEEADSLASEGKAIVWIDGGMHASEKAHGQMTSELAYRIATEETPEMQKIRDEVVTLLMPVMNPDGLDIVVNWYRQNLKTPYETTNPPWLYHHYVGHDNNRDWFMNNMPESYNVSEILYNEWYPQIVYNHHQTAPAWARIFLPPFSDPVNPNIHPGVTTGVNHVGTAMANRFAMEEMPGVASDIQYSMWWNGGMRTTPYFHNQIGILTETAHATPTPRYYAPDSLPATVGGRRGSGLPTDSTDIFYPSPWAGGESHFRDAVDYMLTASMAVLDLAADRRSDLLHNIYLMGRDAIEAGESGGPYAYVIPTAQRDGGEARNLVNILRQGGVEVQRATADFQVGDSSYAAGAFVVPAAQAFRPYVLDLMEPQSYPDRYQYQGGPPEVPYDLAGWTLPLQMDVRVDRTDSTFEASLEPIEERAAVAAGTVEDGASYGYVPSHTPNAGTVAVNRLLARGATVSWSETDVQAGGQTYGAGAIIIAAGDSTASDSASGNAAGLVATLADSLGLDFAALSAEPEGPLHALSLPRVGLYKSWVSNMDEGWTRWLLEEYDFPVDTLHDADVRTGDLSQYDAIVLPDQEPQSLLRGHAAGTMPEAFTGGLGLEGTLALDHYVRQGGTLIAFDAASNFAIEQFGLPVRDVVEAVP